MSSGLQMIMPLGRDLPHQIRTLEAILSVTPLVVDQTDGRKLAREILGERAISNAELNANEEADDRKARQDALAQAKT
jgi:hypothetical protein